MSWSITKKAINSDLSTPLNGLIGDSKDEIIQEIIDKQTGTSLEDKTPTVASLETTNSSLQTVVNVTGSGIATVGICSSSNTISRQARAVITVDGVVIDDTAQAALAIASQDGGRVFGLSSIRRLYAPIGNWGVIRSDVAAGTSVPTTPSIGFKESFKFEMSTTSGAEISGTVVVIS